MPLSNDLSWVLALRSLEMTSVMGGITLLGYGPFLITFMCFGFFFFPARMFNQAALLFFVSVLLNLFLKDWFQDARPDAMYRVDMRAGGSYGWPSGHAQIAITLWGFLALHTRNSLWRGLCIIIAALIIFSRLYLGVHDLGDVFGGTLIGIALLVLWVSALGRASWAQFLWHLSPTAWGILIIAAHVIYYVAYPAHVGHVAPVWILGLMGGWYVGIWIMRVSDVTPSFWPRVLISAVAGAIGFYGMIYTNKLAKTITLAQPLDDGVTYLLGAALSLVITLVLPAILRQLGLMARP